MSATTAKYIRLSSEDNDLRSTGKVESNSVTNQRNLLDSFINRTPELTDTSVIEFCDDGWSGKNFERPAVQEMLTQVREGKIQCIIVKDLSRFGRNYLEVGNYISYVFPFLDVRFIAVNDGFDSIRPMDIDSLETSFKNLLYDLYSRDLSRKVRNAQKFRAQRGDFLSPFAPYGYIKDPANKNRLIIDQEAAETVRRIFQLAADGKETKQIAMLLNRDTVPTPMLYKRAAGCSRVTWPSVREDNFWTNRLVAKILRDERYIGKNIFGKRTRDIVGSTHSVKVKRADWITVENTHEGIVTREEFDRAQASMRAFMERDEIQKHDWPLRGKVRCGICGLVMDYTT
ncbi:MAG: recombinase family protein, partial [Oscillospiraceae bacterium]|nr:recombinase family protein [Oscillospiraceae bacterium]